VPFSFGECLIDVCRLCFLHIDFFRCGKSLLIYFDPSKCLNTVTGEVYENFDWWDPFFEQMVVVAG
jgi:hypothetical protein